MKEAGGASLRKLKEAEGRFRWQEVAGESLKKQEGGSWRKLEQAGGGS